MRGFNGQMGQMGQMMKQAQMLQNNIQKVQAELNNVEVIGEAGSGSVKITMTCKNVCKRVDISESVFTGEADDKEMLEDLIFAALNDAQKKIEKEVEARMKVATGGMKLPF